MTSIVETEHPFVVELESFSGPLDLLLTLIRAQEIEITDIPVAKVADQFLAAIDVLGLNDAANYLDMAAWLMRIKVQMLLPRPFDDEDWEDPRAELVRRLLEYQQIREVSDWLGSQADLRAGRYARGWVPEAPDPGPPPVIIDLVELQSAVERVLEAIPQPVLHRVVARPLDVEGATRRITTMLEERAAIDLVELLGPHPTVADVVSVLLALLELARLGRVRLVQPRPFEAMDIRRESAHATA